eukprot:NODE_194_length_13294_cov_0.803714.p6 type:complete len:381 gc:universal NODE_194_length_13294_cov_0.803714:6269-5127(-)
MPPKEAPLHLNELESPRRPSNLRSPFADVFNNFWASFSTPSKLNEYNDTPIPTTSQKPTPFQSTPFHPTFESSTKTISDSISTLFHSAHSKMVDSIHPIYHILQDILRMVLIPIMICIGYCYKINYSQSKWGRMCQFVFKRNNYFVSQYRKSLKSAFMGLLVLSSIAFHIHLQFKTTNQINSNFNHVQNWVTEYLQSSQKSILSIINQQLDQMKLDATANQIEPEPEAKPRVPRQIKRNLSPSISHLFQIESISSPLIHYPDHVLGQWGLIWTYSSYPPSILLENEPAVLGKNYCTRDDLNIKLSNLTDILPHFISIKWPLSTKPVEYAIPNVIMHYSIKSDFEIMDIFEILPRNTINVQIKSQSDSTCAYKIGLHQSFQ